MTRARNEADRSRSIWLRDTAAPLQRHDVKPCRAASTLHALGNPPGIDAEALQQLLNTPILQQTRDDVRAASAIVARRASPRRVVAADPHADRPHLLSHEGPARESDAPRHIPEGVDTAVGASVARLKTPWSASTRLSVWSAPFGSVASTIAVHRVSNGRSSCFKAVEFDDANLAYEKAKHLVENLTP